MADDLALEWSGLTEIADRFGRIQPVVQREMGTALKRTFDVASKALATYPPVRPGQTYIRTGNLGSGWTKAKPAITVGANQIAARLLNTTPYLPHVQGDKQARAHQGRWLTIRLAQERITDIYGPLHVNDALGAIGRFLEGNG